MMLNQLLTEGVFSGVHIGDDISINHLQFADDTLLFCEKDVKQLDRLCTALFAFIYASGLKLNTSKSMLVGCHVDEHTFISTAGRYGWCRGAFPIIYLGMPLGGNPRRRIFWEPTLDKIRAKSRSYNSKYLSLSGRLVLLKAALVAIPLYPMSIFKAPVGVISEIEKIFIAFLWGKEGGGRRV